MLVSAIILAGACVAGSIAVSSMSKHTDDKIIQPTTINNIHNNVNNINNSFNKKETKETAQLNYDEIMDELYERYKIDKNLEGVLTRINNLNE